MTLSNDNALQKKWIISIENLNIDVFVGLRDFEQGEKQKLLITLKCEAIYPIPQQADDPYVCYDQLIQTIKSFLSSQTHVAFLETLCDQICSICLQNPLIQSAKVTLSKPKINTLLGATISMTTYKER